MKMQKKTVAKLIARHTEITDEGEVLYFLKCGKSEVSYEKVEDIYNAADKLYEEINRHLQEADIK